ncbi:MAG: insulinase family protein, partial [Bacilli bacterium]|nr:insulinase family protein [Bacilli bacterium]
MRTNYIKKTLSNGVKLYLYLDKNMKKYYVDYGVNYGSNGKWHKFYFDDEYYEVPPGCAHFLEHMLGEHSKYGNFYNYMSSKKYQINAATYYNVTHFYFQGTEDIYDCIEKLINVIDNPIFNDDDIAHSKRAIAEETKRVLNNRIRMGCAILGHNIYKDLNLFDETYCTIGNEETTNKLDYKTLKTCYDAFYYDENKTLIIAGNFDEDELTNFLEETYSKLSPHPKRLREFSYKALHQKKKDEQIYYMTTKDDFFSMGFKQENDKFSRKEVFYLLAFLSDIKFSSETPFIKKLKKEDIL